MMFTDYKKDENTRYENDINNAPTHENQTPPDWDDIPSFGTEHNTISTNTSERQHASEADESVMTNLGGLKDNPGASRIPKRQTIKTQKPSSLSVRSRDIKNSLLNGAFFDTRKGKIITLLIIFVFIAVIFSLKSGGDIKPESSKIVVLMPAGVIKEAPVDPEGMHIEYLDKAVYGAVNDVGKQQEETVEKLLPKIEKPIVIKNTKTDVVIITPKKVTTPKKVATPKKVVITKKVTTPKKVVVTKKVTTPKKVVATKKVVKNTAVAVVNNSGNSWRIQFASVNAKTAAEKEFAKYLQKYSALKGKKLFIEVAVINGKTYQRLQVIGYKTKSLANSACASIIAQGGQCLVKKS